MSVLFPILTVYTLVYLGLMIYDFAAKAAFEMPSGMMAVYVALVGAYAADKEIRRWLGKGEPQRAGSVFVYLWLLFFLVAFVIRSFKPEFTLPSDLGVVTLQVLGIFFGSKASMKIYEMKKKDVIALTREQAVMDMIKENGKVTKKQVMLKLAISDSTALRLLDSMEVKKLIMQVGKYKDTYYVAVEEGKE